MTTQPYTPIVPLTDVDTNLQNDIDKLNYLLRMEHNSVRGYEHAIDNANDENLKARFKEHRQAHSERGTRISNMITSLNGQPETDGSIAGVLHRNWVDLKTAVANDDSEAIMEAVVFGERNLDEAYEDLLNNGKLESQDVHDTIARMHQDVHAMMETTEKLAKAHDAS